MGADIAKAMSAAPGRRSNSAVEAIQTWAKFHRALKGKTIQSALGDLVSAISRIAYLEITVGRFIRGDAECRRQGPFETATR
jgi:hypothetical protein